MGKKEKIKEIRDIEGLVRVKKPEYPERTTDHGQATGKLYHLRM
jgi:hypothetical protein